MSVLQTDFLKFAFCEVWVVITDVKKAVLSHLTLQLNC